MKPGSPVIAHFVTPTEKYWGELVSLGPEGVTLRGLSVASFDDWLAQVGRGEQEGLALTTLFVPLYRVERMFLDEAAGGAPSYCDRLMQRTGKSLSDFTGENTGS